MDPVRLAILTISDGVAAGVRDDRSGRAIEEWASERGHSIVARESVPDDGPRIAESVMRFSDQVRADLILTTGGTGFTERDNTPEATRSIIQREAPGIAEAIRSRGASVTPWAWLSRGVAGIRNRSLIVNLPGSESGVRDGLTVMDDVARHAVQLLRGIDTARHEPGDG